MFLGTKLYSEARVGYRRRSFLFVLNRGLLYTLHKHVQEHKQSKSHISNVIR